MDQPLTSSRMLPPEPLCLIAISGGSGSGKSTLANALMAVLGPDLCAVLGDDHYYKTRASQGVEGLSAPEIEALINYDDLSSKDMDLMFEHALALKRGETIHQPLYDFAAHDRVKDDTLEVVPRRITILEGIHVLGDPRMAELFDLKVYVDTPDDLRLARRILRDTAPEDEGGRGRSVSRVISQYLHFVRPTHHRVTGPAKYAADLVIADEGLPAFAAACPSRAAVQRMLAPVIGWLIDTEIVSSDEIQSLPFDDV